MCVNPFDLKVFSTACDTATKWTVLMSGYPSIPCLPMHAVVAAFSFDQSVMLERLIFTPCSYQHAAGASLQSRSLCPIQPLLHPLSLPPSLSLSVSTLSVALFLMSCNNTHTELCSQSDRSGWQVKYGVVFVRRALLPETRLCCCGSLL